MHTPIPQGATVWRDALGGIVIESRVGKPTGRKGFERQYFPGVDVGLIGWERAHSQGNITGHESPYAIRYAPREVNQAYQRLGIERFIRELFETKAPDVELLLATVTYTHPGTLRLAEIQYRVDVLRRNRKIPLFEAAIMVENKRVSPRVTTSATERTPRGQWEQFMR